MEGDAQNQPVGTSDATGDGDGQEDTKKVDETYKAELRTVYLEQSNRFNTSVTHAAGLGSAIVAALLSFGDLFHRAPTGAAFLIVSAVILILSGVSSGVSDFLIQGLFSKALDKAEIHNDRLAADKLVETANNRGGVCNWITAILALIGALAFVFALVAVRVDYRVPQENDSSRTLIKGEGAKFEFETSK